MLFALLSAIALAQDPEGPAQYRHFKLADGREFDAIILQTEAAGFRVRVPQGETGVPFSQLYDMVPVAQADYDAQPDWVVYLAAPEERRKGLAAAFQTIPHVKVYGDPGTESLIPTTTLQVAGSCDIDVECIGKALADLPQWIWIVVARQEGTEIVFEAQTNRGGPARNPVHAGMIDVNALNQSAWRILDLNQIQDSTSEVPIEPTGRDRRVALSYAPVPGLPSLVEKDYAGFGLALATTVPATALWIGAVGKNSQSAPQHIALGIGGFYAITVAVNQIVALRGKDDAVSVGISPADEKGGTLVRLTVAK